MIGSAGRKNPKLGIPQYTSPMPNISPLKNKSISLLAGSGLVLLLVALVLVVFPTGRKPPKHVTPEPPPPRPLPWDDSNGDGGKTPSPPIKPIDPLKLDPPEAIDTSPIESILNDKELSFEESATRLLECTRQENMPMEVRLAALDHAFNLDRWQALTLCMDKPLPSPIAGRLLSGIHNLNESRKDQVSACLHLIEHEDPEIRSQAQELLAFLVSSEELASDPDKLREKADAFLGQVDEMGEEVSGQ
jgi:hypothetical protein